MTHCISVPTYTIFTVSNNALEFVLDSICTNAIGLEMTRVVTMYA